jgi:tryptophanyl-tRNA synthetase
LYHLVESDKELEELYQDCKNGNIMCGECKMNAAAMIRKFFDTFSKKREKAKEKAREILNGEYKC